MATSLYAFGGWRSRRCGWWGVVHRRPEVWPTGNSFGNGRTLFSFGRYVVFPAPAPKPISEVPTRSGGFSRSLPDPADRVGTSQIEPTAKIRAGTTEHRPTSSPERPFPSELPLDQASSRPRTIPRTDILYPHELPPRTRRTTSVALKSHRSLTFGCGSGETNPQERGSIAKYEDA